jgi:peptidyl-prolyl cis-trans isomerase A (cyclophilin A)
MKLHMTGFQRIIFSLGFSLAACTAAPEHPIVILDTEAGEVRIAVHEDRAPISAGDFLRYVDNGLYDGQGFYRTVRSDNDPRSMGMSLVQGGRLDREVVGEPIAHELTTETGLSNITGTIAIARLEPGSGSATYFFINLGDNSFLDTGGTRNPDGQGYATFGQVISGLDVLRNIQAGEVARESDDDVTVGQILAKPVIITRAYREDETPSPR